MITQNSRLKYMGLVILGMLLIPLIASQFSEDVNWTLFDFILAGLLLFGTGLLIEFIIRKTDSKKSRLLLIILITITLVLTWIELAVGIFGTPLAGS